MKNVGKRKFTYHDLSLSRIRKYESDICAMVDILENSWVDPFCVENQLSELICISTGQAAAEEVGNDLLKAAEISKAAYSDFKQKRIEASKTAAYAIKTPAFENIFICKKDKS